VGGGSVELNWVVTHAGLLTLEPGCLTVNPTPVGSLKVEVSTSTTFTLIAGDSIINAVSTASVCVQSGPVDCGGSLPDAGP